MKTIREHLNDLPEPYRTEALENAKNSKPSTLHAMEKSMSGAITGAFLFHETPQGADYWFDLADELMIKNK